MIDFSWKGGVETAGRARMGGRLVLDERSVMAVVAKENSDNDFLVTFILEGKGDCAAHADADEVAALVKQVFGQGSAPVFITWIYQGHQRCLWYRPEMVRGLLRTQRFGEEGESTIMFMAGGPTVVMNVAGDVHHRLVAEFRALQPPAATRAPAKSRGGR